MKRMVSLLLVILMMFSVIPAATQAESSVYQEKEIELPAGFSHASAMSHKPGGGFVAACKSVEGKWALINWESPNATPTITELLHQGADIDHLSVAPDGSILLGLSNLPPMDDMDDKIRIGSPVQEREQAFSVSEEAVEGTESGDLSAVVGFANEFIMDDAYPTEEESSFTIQNDEMSKSTETGPNVFRMGPDDMKSEMLWIDASGAELARFFIDGFLIDVKALTGRKMLSLNPMQGPIIYDDRGMQQAILGNGRFDAVAAYGDALCTIEEGKLETYNPETGEKITSMDIMVKGSPSLSIDESGIIYMMDSTGVYTLDLETCEQVCIMNSMGTLIGDPSNAITSFAHAVNGAFVALVEEGAGSMGGGVSIRIGVPKALKLLAYTAREDIDLNSRIDFSIAALRTSTRLQKASSEFQRLHPELNVKLQTQMELDDESPIEDHIRTLNTDLLAGKGADVLVLDDLPMDKYVERGLLLDLTGRFDDVNMLSGLRKAMTALDGKTYAIPAQFAIDLLWGKKELVDQVQSLSEIEKINLPKNQVPFAPRSKEDWLKLFYPSSENAFRDASGNIQFTSAKFIEFLTALQSIYSRQGEMPDDALIADDPFQTEVLAVMNGAAAFYANRFSSTMDASLGYTIAGAQAADCTSMPTIDGKSSGILPSLKLGIGTNTQQPELAEEFIHLMLSDEIQNIEMGEGLPTLADALDALFEDALARSRNENLRTMISFGGTPIELKQPDEAILSRIRELINEANQQIQIDDTLIEFIGEESKNFFDGDQDASTVGVAIEQRAWSYLNE